MPNHSWKIQCTSALVIALTAAPIGSHAQSFPTKPIKLVVPATAGGPSDVLARMLAQGLSKELGQPMIVENVPGGGGSIAQARIARGPADGYTLFLGNVGQLAANPVFVGKLSYDTAKDFRAVASVADAPQVVSARSDLPVSNFDEFADYVRVHEKDMNWATGGVGSGAHLGGLLVNRAIGANVNTVHYPGSAQAINDVMGGRIDYMIESITTAVSSAATGKVKAIAVLGGRRSNALPEVPSIAESKLSGLRYEIWNMLVVSRNTPDDIVNKLNVAVNSTLESAAIAEQFNKLGLLIPGPNERTATGATALLESELIHWRNVLVAAGVKPGDVQ